MRGLIFLVVIIPFALLLVSQIQQAMHETPEDELTEAQKVARLLEGMSFNTPKSIEVLYNDRRVDKQARVELKTLILKTDEEYLPRSPKSIVDNDDVLKLLQKDLPGYDFGQAVNDKAAAHFRWLTPADEEWTVSSIKTSNGYFSRWKRRADLFQIMREE